MPIDRMPPYVTDGLIGVIGGAVAGAVAMLYQKFQTDKRIDGNEKSVREIERTYMSRNEIMQLHREGREDTLRMHNESKAEMKAMHEDQNDKLDKIIDKLSEINLTLANKVDRK